MEKKERKEESSSLPLIDRRTWDEYFDAPEAHKDRHGSYAFLQNHDKKLYDWMKKQSRDCRKLTQQQRDRLDELGFDWETAKERANRVWNVKFHRLVAYQREHGNCSVPQLFPKDQTLGHWVATRIVQEWSTKPGAPRETRVNWLQMEV